jgi:formylmethanofuran dehydrogenase subunit E
VLPDEVLFKVEHVLVLIPVEDMPGPPQLRVICGECGEGINDSRDVMIAGNILCRSCAYGSYYQRSRINMKSLLTNRIKVNKRESLQTSINSSKT